MQSAREITFDENLVKAAASIDVFEAYAEPHASRIAAIACDVAARFNIGSHDLVSLRHAALIHDIGEMLMNREYIKANRPLTADERLDLHRHTVIGEQEAAKRGLSRAVQLLVRWHHEWWNGSGYPDALEREQIPLAARILRVADTYCALTVDRPFRAKLSGQDAARYIVEWAGIEFDPQVAQALLALESASGPELHIENTVNSLTTGF
jgi:HD-GYP domain-containing protein (c-di-GMP phosphodiesterase class II)